MSTNRLNASQKSQILNAVMTHGFAAREAELKMRSKILGDKVYSMYVVSEEQEKLIAQLPRSFFTYSDNLSIEVKNSLGRSYTIRLLMSKARPMPSGWVNGAWYDTKIDNRDIIERSTTLLNAQELLKEDRQAYHKKVAQVLQSKSSLASLAKDWPEIMPIVDKLKLYSDVKSTALAPVMADLNKTLGLPPEVKVGEEVTCEA